MKKIFGIISFILIFAFVVPMHISADNAVSANSAFNADVAVFCPYGDSGRYVELGEALATATGGDCDAFMGAYATPQSLKNADNYGIIIIDTPTMEIEGSTYLLFQSDEGISEEDFCSGNAVSLTNAFGVTGAFFESYCTRFPNSLVWLSADNGMSNDSLCAALLDLGCGVVTGYSRYATVEWWSDFSSAFFNKLISGSDVADSFVFACDAAGSCDTYLTDAAYALCVSTSDSFPDDPYAENIPVCDWRLPVEGGIETIAPSSVELSPAHAELYIGERIRLITEILPLDAYGFSVNFTSSDSTVATVDEYGYVTAVRAGSAEIICTVSGTDNGEYYSFETRALLEVVKPSGICYERVSTPIAGERYLIVCTSESKAMGNSNPIGFERYLSAEDVTIRGDFCFVDGFAPLWRFDGAAEGFVISCEGGYLTIDSGEYLNIGGTPAAFQYTGSELIRSASADYEYVCYAEGTESLPSRFTTVGTSGNRIALYRSSGDFLLGDVDNDGELTAADALIVLRMAIEVVNPAYEQLLIADLDGDGTITAADALRLLRSAVL